VRADYLKNSILRINKWQCNLLKNQKMKYTSLLLITFLSFTTSQSQNKTIFITGGAFGKPYIQYVASLTNKQNPKICFVPTASADNPYAILGFYNACEDLPVRPYILRTFINSNPNQKTWEEAILSMDVIIVGGWKHAEHDGHLEGAGHRYGIQKSIR